MSMFLVQAINIQDFHKMIGRLFLVFLLIQSTFGQRHHHRPAALAAPPAQPWLTLNGQRPVVIARGGYTGLFPESSDISNRFAIQTSLSDVIIYCSLQLSSDGNGFCISSLQLDNTTNIADIYPNGQKTYNVNGRSMQGYFSLDYNSDQLYNVSLVQGVFSRPAVFDGMPMATVDEVIRAKPPRFWINVQYSSFYALHDIDPALYVEDLLKTTDINFISSPEIGFLKKIQLKVDKNKTHLVFVFLEAHAIEPTTNQTYGSLLKDLSAIKLFASAILVPKDYIWPVNAQMYLEAPTTLVPDAHKLGLEVYAYIFTNDNSASYNYSYDPTAEYLQFIDNSHFSVDGFLTDFPSTASESIACLAHNKNASRPVEGRALVISHNGASGVYPGSTDLAYQQAVDDGADIIDCSVQMTKDGVAFCLNSTDLSASTTAKATFMPRFTNIPEIQSSNGIFSVDLTWSEIQTLQPLIASPFSSAYGFQRNPANKNKGKLITFAEFLEFAKQKKVHGILINIKNAAYLASKKGLSITDAVSTALSNATFDKETTQQVFIQSDDTQVLAKFRNFPTYKRVLLIGETISEAPKATVDEIKKYADAVNIRRTSVITTSDYFTTGVTSVVQDMHKANITVFASIFRNEFFSIAMDYFTNPMIELATYTSLIRIDGIVTEYPATAAAYLRSPCSNPDANMSFTILPVQPGSLLQTIPEETPLPPAEAPAPPLKIADIANPPLPPVHSGSIASTSFTEAEAPDAATAPPAATKSSQTANVANSGLTLIAIMVLSLLSIAC